MIKTYSRVCKPRELPLPSGELPVEYESSCRLCLEKHDDMVLIYNGKDIIPVPVKIRTCISIEVLEDDGLPKMICRNCYDQLEELYRFKKRCLATDVKLRQLVTVPPFRTDFYETPDVITLNIKDDGNDEESIRNACTLIDFEGASHLAPIFTCIDENKKLEPCTKPLLVSNSHRWVDKQQGRNENSLNDIQVEDPLKIEIGAEDSTNNVDSTSIEGSETKLFGRRKNQHINYEDMNLKQRLEMVNGSETDENVVRTRRKGNRKKTDSGQFNCSHCNRTFSTSKKCSAHKLIHTVGKVCEFCKKPFATRSLLIRHLRVHTGERPFGCDVCEKRFSQKEILLRHKSLHVEVMSHVCTVCNKAYGLPEALKYHIRLKHPAKKVIYKCQKCDKVFRHSSGLSRHQHKHFGTMFSCKVCNKTFSDMVLASRHVSKHAGVGKKAELKSYISKLVCRKQS